MKNEKFNPSVYNPVSPTDTYVIYDQFHWLRDNHLAVSMKGHANTLILYAWYKECFPTESIALASVEYYNQLLKQMRAKER